MRGIIGLEQAEKDKQHLECCLEKADDKRHQDSIQAQDERTRLEQRLAEALKDKDHLKAEAQRTAVELVKEQRRWEEMGKQWDELKDQLQDTKKTVINFWKPSRMIFWSNSSCRSRERRLHVSNRALGTGGHL